MADKGNDPAVVWPMMIAEWKVQFFANQAMLRPVLQGDEPGRRCRGGRSSAGEMMENILSAEPAEPAQHRRTAERLQSIRASSAEIKGDAQPENRDSGAGGMNAGTPRRRAPDGLRRRAKMNAPAAPRSGVDSEADSVRGAARDQRSTASNICPPRARRSARRRRTFCMPAAP
jgi:hypothetical protein